MRGIICFGDSITFGRGESPAVGWCGRLKDWFESIDPYNAVYNLGIPGDTSSGLLERIEIELKSRRRLIREGDEFEAVIAIGTNDLRYDGETHQIDVDKFKLNIKKILDIVSGYVDNYYVLEIPPVYSDVAIEWESFSYSNSDVEAYNAVLRSFAGNHFVNLEFMDWNDKIPDMIHPNSIGYEDMFVQIKKAIEERSFLLE